MGTSNLPLVSATTVQLSHVNDIISAIKGEWVGRNSATGAVQSGQSLGTVTVPWGTAYITELNVNGSPIDLQTVTATPNRVVSGQTVSGSDMADYIRANGASASATIEGATTDLVVEINGTQVTVTTDISLSSLTTAPSTNNTALVNDTSYTDQDITKYAGEWGVPLNIDTAGSEWTALVGKWIAFQHGTGEYSLGYLKSSTQLINCYRGFFFNSSGNGAVKETVADNDTLTLMELGWVFLDNSGTSADVSYTNPVWSDVEPASPATGDYWYDLSIDEWKRYSGSAFVSINRTFIGWVVMDSTNCVASRSLEFDKGWQELNNLQLEKSSATVIKTIDGNSRYVNVYGKTYYYNYSNITWDITTDLESGFTEAADTVYYAYITEDGAPKLSPERPLRRPDMRGFYHPYQSWRCVGWCFNDASSDIDFAGAFTMAVGDTKQLTSVTVSAATRAYIPVSLALWDRGLSFLQTIPSEYIKLNVRPYNLVGSTTTTLAIVESKDFGVTWGAFTNGNALDIGTSTFTATTNIGNISVNGIEFDIDLFYYNSAGTPILNAHLTALASPLYFAGRYTDGAPVGIHTYIGFDPASGTITGTLYLSGIRNPNYGVS